MTLQEIYSTISTHFIKGLMVHSQLMSYFNFLGLEGYSKDHKHHYISESKNYLKLCNYYTTHHNFLIIDKQISDPHIIPDDWFYKERKQINPKDYPNLISKAFNKWIEWEKDTKELLQTMYYELVKIEEIASALFISKFIKDVDNELKEAEEQLMLIEATGYDMSYIVEQQK